MASINVSLTDEVHLRLLEKAAQNGQSLAEYLNGLLKREADTVKEFRVLKEPPPPVRRQTDEEFERWMAELKTRPPVPMPAVPCEWTREDIYFDHD
jgi:hypothetical protein